MDAAPREGFSAAAARRLTAEFGTARCGHDSSQWLGIGPQGWPVFRLTLFLDDRGDAADGWLFIHEAVATERIVLTRPGDLDDLIGRCKRLVAGDKGA